MEKLCYDKCFMGLGVLFGRLRQRRARISGAFGRGTKNDGINS